MDVAVVIVAAGMGRRMNSKTTKQLLKIGGKPILWHTVNAFQQMESVDEIIVVVKEDEKEFIQDTITKTMDKVSKVVSGGEERSDSVRCGIEAVAGQEIVMIHDGARPFIEESSIKRLLHTLEQCDAAILAVPVKDTIKEVNDVAEVTKTFDRQKLWAAQTPQAFKSHLIKTAFEKAGSIMRTIYDDSMLIESVTDTKVKIVQGSDCNIKITTPLDLVIGEAIYKMSKGVKDV